MKNKTTIQFAFVTLLMLIGTTSWSQSTIYNYTGNLQSYTVPAGVTSIQVEAFGAEGGASTGQSGGMLWQGGQGAYVSGEFAVTPGQTLDILVGGMGLNGNCGSGGGGGSFVENTGVLLVAAGGGGGGFHCNVLGGVLGGDGAVNESGDGGICTPNRFPQPGGTSGNGGSSYYGGGGGGYYGAGIATAQATNAGGQYPGAGGIAGGGYGGGGGYYSSCCGGSGGGGGYSGGSGGQSDGCAGGGGGSYNAGANQTITAGLQSGNGQVIITELCMSLNTNVSAIELCEGEMVTLSATSTGAGVITWDNGVMNGVAFAPPVGTTTYTATSTDINDCVFTVDITMSLTPDVDGGQDIILCSGVIDTALVATGTADIYTWNNGVVDGVQFTPSFGTTTYVVIGENIPSGCSSSDTVLIQVGSPSITLNATDEMLGNDGSVSLTINSGNAPFTFDWSNGSTTNDISGLIAGTYTVIMTDASGCSVTDSITVGSQLGLITGSFSSLNIYPNPTNSILNISLEGDFEYSITNLLGKKVAFGNGMNTSKVNMSKLANGAYIMNIVSKGEHKSIRIMKQ